MPFQNVIEVNNISKAFPGVQALKDVSMSVKFGEVHGLVGENGAGKSTLIQAIMGVNTIDKGEIKINDNDKWITVRNPIEARQHGLFANYQTVNVAQELSVGENYFMGKMPLNKIGLVNWNNIYKNTKEILKKFNMDDINPLEKIKDLTPAKQEMVNISRIVLYEKLNLVIFDEPTALLGVEKVEILFNFIKELKKKNIGIIYVSHRLEEVMEICDRVTVLRDGKFIDTLKVKDTNISELVFLMVGRKLDDVYNIQHEVQNKELIAIENFSLKEKFKNISFKVKKGEILGLFGLIGSGRSDLCRTLFGLEKRNSGKIKINGKEIKLNNPNQAMASGIGLITEDRFRALALPLSVKVNINANSYALISKFGVINLKKEKKRAEFFKESMKIKTPSLDGLVNKLSGGNQQKVLLSRLLCREPNIFIFDEPTLGIDVGSKIDIYRLIEKVARDGNSVIVVSSYLPELINLANRIIVMSEGEIVGEVMREDFNNEVQTKILKMASKIS